MSRADMRWILAVALASALVACGDDDNGRQAGADTGEDTVSIDGGTDAGPDAEGDVADAEEDVADAEDGGADAVDAADAEQEPDGSGIPNDFPPIPHTEPVAGYDPDGHPDIVAALDAGQVRAGRIDDWNTTFGGQETDCRLGDYKIYNSRVQFCIAGPISIADYTLSGGQLIDADFAGASNDRFFLNTPQSHLMLPGVDQIEVLADGSDGLAVVSVTGPEQPLGILIYELGENLFPRRGVAFTTEYRLRPDVDYLEIVTWIRADVGDHRPSAGDFTLFGDTSDLFVPGVGRAWPTSRQDLEFAAATALGRSYALYHPGGMSNMAIDLSELSSRVAGIVMVAEATGRLPGGEEAAYRRYFIVGDGGTDSIRAAIAEIDGTEPPSQSVQLTVTEAEAPRSGLHLLISPEGELVRDVLVTDADGEAALPLEPGTYVVEVEDWVAGPVTPQTFEVEAGTDAEVSIALPEAAELHFSVTAVEEAGGDPQPSPAKIDVFAPRGARLFTSLDGSAIHRGPPGSYRVVVSRGWEYSAVELVDLEVGAGEVEEVNAELVRLWDTDGLISGEFHQHCTRSADSIVTETDRILSNIVEGVDFVVPSDHDAVTDFTPWIAELGAESLIYAMPGSEVSPFSFHFNPMPMPYDPTQPNGGFFAKTRVFDDFTYERRTLPDMIADLRANWGVEVVQVNHPRGGAAYFDYTGYDPMEGPDELDPRIFTSDFNSVEVFNSRGDFCRVFRDWLGFVARGYPIAGVGNSDTHSLGSEAGYPRSYLHSDATSPLDMTDRDILDPLLDLDVSVAGGALITFPGGPHPGDTVEPAGGEVVLPVRLQTAAWARLDRLQVVLGGEIVRDIELDAEASEIVVFDEDITLAAPNQDSYVVVVAYGTQRMSIVNPGEYPFAFTNPVFIDVDGSGWMAPGVSGPDDLPSLDIPWCD